MKLAKWFIWTAFASSCKILNLFAVLPNYWKCWLWWKKNWLLKSFWKNLGCSTLGVLTKEPSHPHHIKFRKTSFYSLLLLVDRSESAVLSWKALFSSIKFSCLSVPIFFFRTNLFTGINYFQPEFRFCAKKV